METKKIRIKIFTRSFSLELYSLSRTLYEGLEIPIVRLTDKTADGYFFSILKDTECDVAINIDEDAFLINPDALLELVNFVVEHNYANVGCPDGGMALRIFNPIITNPFFNVLNLKLIRTKLIGKNEINAFDYLTVCEEMKARFPIHILKGRYDFKYTNQEPYYPFFFWLAYNFDILYLPAETHTDGISTILYSPDKSQIICLHAWFARFYKMSLFAKIFLKKRGVQTQRITNLITESYELRQLPRPIFTTYDYLRFNADMLLRWSIKVPQRIMGWPRKWAKWYRRWERKRQGAI